LKWSQLPRSSYYYHPLTGKRGRKPSTHTWLTDGSIISNESVVIAIRFVVAEEFMISTGYIKIRKDLVSYGFIINKKKVYNLMKRYQLLSGTVIRAGGEMRKFVKWLVQKAVRPMEQLCMDIKYVYIQGEKRNALLLTVLDVYSRSIIGQILWWRIRKEHVIWLLHRTLQQHSTKGITLRNDNGSQFIAHAVRNYLKEKEVQQEFIHVATPEENCFIEAYHSILEKQLLQNTEFTDIEDAIAVFSRWRKFYNERRRHGSIGQRSPKQLWDEYEKYNFVKSGQAEAGNAGEQPARNNLMNGENQEGVQSTPSTSGFFFVPMPQKTQKKTNCFEKSVQLLGG
jgi:transposase InsO family protein